MAEGRPLHGDDFIENMQDYVEERMTYAGDSDELAEANRALQQEERDLQTQERGQTTQSQPNMDALEDEAQLPGRMDRAHGATSIEAEGDGAVNYRHLAPEDEARSRVTRGINDRSDQSSIDR